MAGGAFNMPTQAWAWHPTGMIRPVVAGKMPTVQKAGEKPAVQKVGGAFNMPTQAWAWHPTGRIRPAVAGKMPAVQPKAVQQPGGCLVGRH